MKSSLGRSENVTDAKWVRMKTEVKWEVRVKVYEIVDGRREIIGIERSRH